VRVLEEFVRGGGVEPELTLVVDPEPSGTNPRCYQRPAGDRGACPSRGCSKLEELLSTHLNTRVKVELQNRRGRLVVDFATLEGSRAYSTGLMVGEQKGEAGASGVAEGL